MDFITNIKAGEILATKYPPTKGKYGMNIFSEKIFPKPEKPAKFNLGRGIKIENNKAISDLMDV